jgi:hypothetical protein
LQSFGERLLPDGPELIDKFIGAETDVAARRNAFLMLFNEAEALAIEYAGFPFSSLPPSQCSIWFICCSLPVISNGVFPPSLSLSLARSLGSKSL